MLFKVTVTEDPLRRVKVICMDLLSIAFIRHFFNQAQILSRFPCSLIEAVEVAIDYS